MKGIRSPGSQKIALKTVHYYGKSKFRLSAAIFPDMFKRAGMNSFSGKNYPGQSAITDKCLIGIEPKFSRKQTIVLASNKWAKHFVLFKFLTSG